MNINQLNAIVDQADNNPRGLVSWIGASGLKMLQQSIISTLRERGIVTVPNTTALQAQTFNNTPVCYLIGGGFYRWNATGTPNGTTIFPAADGGVWASESMSNVGNLQQVTNNGNTTTNDIIAKKLIANEEVMSDLFSITNSGSLVFDTGIFTTTVNAETATAYRSIIIPNETGTLATREWVQANPPSSPTYIYTQTTPSATWVVNHNLNSYPSVTCVDSLDSQIVGALEYTNVNQLIITFSLPVFGRAFLN
jgi:predicted nucleic acid-binding Zn ribbon protein